MEAEQLGEWLALVRAEMQRLETTGEAASNTTRLVDYKRSIEFAIMEAYNQAYRPELATQALIHVAALAIEAAALCAAGKGKQ